MPSTFCNGPDAYATTLAIDYTAGGSSFVLAPGGGSPLSPSPSSPVRVVVVAAAALDPYGRVVDRSKVTVYKATGVTGDTLTGVTLESGAAQAYPAGSVLFVGSTAAAFADVHAAIRGLQSGGGTVTSADPLNVMSSGTVVGDGVTDDGPALQALIDANPCRSIYFPTRRIDLTQASYYSGRTLAVTGQGTKLRGEGASWGGGTILKFAKGVTGIDIQSGSSGASLENLILVGGSPWVQIYPSQTVLPGGWTGSALADAVCPTADGVRVGASQCSLTNVFARDFDRHGFNFSNADCSGTSDTCLVYGCYANNNRGLGFYTQGGDSNASLFLLCQASVNGIGGFHDGSFLGNTYVGCKCDENHFDNAQSGTGDPHIPAAQALASLSRVAGVVTLTFSAPYGYTDTGGGAFVVGQGVTVTGMGDATYNGTFIVHEVASTSVIRYAQAGGNGTPSVAGATARLARARETWAAAGETLIPSTGGGFRTSANPASRTRIVNLYTEGSQNPTGDAALPFCCFGSGTTGDPGIGLIVDLTYGIPALYGQVGGVGKPGSYGSLPSANVPIDETAQYVEQLGLTADQDSMRTRRAFDGSVDNTHVLWEEFEGPTRKALYRGRFAGGAPLVWYVDHATGNVTFGAGLACGAGATGARPTTTVAGTMFYDTTLGKPVWWSGSVWKDAAGATV